MLLPCLEQRFVIYGDGDGGKLWEILVDSFTGAQDSTAGSGVVTPMSDPSVFILVDNG